jgi:hypothetical protein
MRLAPDLQLGLLLTVILAGSCCEWNRLMWHQLTLTRCLTRISPLPNPKGCVGSKLSTGYNALQHRHPSTFQDQLLQDSRDS